ncbi:penicillin-binding protein activator [Pseudothioclava arenosa]|uniref:Penicillin-binding protein activator n=1 Tax=Pseudothioclava arenosa TaxID=1795308 RepID=A0A2A4CPA2_9RHOB|nr:penicillin-binding protein activator [Pseudothioclava arenosa]PCD76140.1 penicillin-binding protein activator [Pseudothioclava arenosa]
MFAIFRIPRNPLLRIGALLSAGWLAACQPMGGFGPNSGPSIDTSAPVPVALLVPGGSGKEGEETLARALQNAAQMAISDLQGVKIDLRVYQTGGNAQLSAQMATKAVDEGAKIILGPVHAENANAAGVAVASRGVNVLSFSNNTAIAGGNVFVLGSTFPNTANRLMRHAASQGKKRTMIVSEETTAGQVAARAIEGAAARAGVSIVGRASYAFSQQGVATAVPQIAGRIKAGDVDSVILTADAAGALPLLAQMLPDSGAGPDKAQFIGLARWDIPPATLSLPGLQGGWFTLPDPGLSRQFEARYQAAYGEAPHVLAGLAYDGVAAIGALVRSGNPDALTKAGLTQSQGFAGVNGVFRLLPDGTNERGLAVAQVRNGEAIIVDPAPRSFSGAGY